MADVNMHLFVFLIFMGLDRSNAACNVMGYVNCFSVLSDVNTDNMFQYHDKVCRAWDGLKTCMESSLSSCMIDATFQQTYGSLYSMMDYMCVLEKAKFDKHLPCLARKAVDPATLGCFKEAADNYASQVDQICKFLDDGQTCWYNAAACCGNEAADLVNGLYTVGYNQTRQLLSCAPADSLSSSPVCNGGSKTTVWTPLVLLFGIMSVRRYVF
ncbi:hypothetical protein ScPMuIL_005794 [Solemya velum]